MASPRELGLIIECGLRIELRETFTGADVTDSCLRWKYRITRGVKIDNPQFGREGSLEGWLSPLASVTLSEEELKKAGIPKKAKTFAFMYPPQEVVEMYIRNDSCLIIENGNNEREGIISAITLGGFAYFDDDLNFMQLNALSHTRAVNTIRFTGPFQVSESTCLELYKMKKKNADLVCRTQNLTLERFREAGFVSFAWVRPEEKFNFKPALNNHENKHGALVYIRENGTGVAYAVDQTRYVDQTGYKGILSDVFGMHKDSVSSQNPMKSVFEVKDWKTKNELRISTLLDTKNSETSEKKITKNLTARLINSLVDQKTLFHMSCHADLSADFFEYLLDTQDNRNLSYSDAFGWTPLHYACRFITTDKIIKLLVDKCPEAVMIADKHGRYPLHIACDSDGSDEVIKTLLAADKSPTKVTLTSPTKKIKLLPIHFACYQHITSGSIIEVLLEADKDGRTTVTETDYGQLPLHLAILTKSHESTVKMLLDADSKLQASSISVEPDIYSTFEGKLPLHWACWNNSSFKVIELLLEKDELNRSVYETISVNEIVHSFSSRRNANCTFQDDPNLSDTDVERAQSLVSLVSQRENSIEGSQTDGVALHLAMKFGCIDVIGLLLQKETDPPPNGMNRPIYVQDITGRTPLHIGCEFNVNSQVIRDLLKLDSTKKTIQIYDKDGFGPLHYACRNKSTSIETVNILCGAEEQRISCAKIVSKEKHINATNQTKKSPLYLAILAGAKDEIIDRLLQPEKFGLESFDESSMNKLATMITESKIIQSKILGILSDRLYFSVLMLEFYANIIALVAFIYGSIDLRAETGGKTEPFLLLVCTTIFISRELLDIMSVGKNYVRDLWNIADLLNIIFLIIAVVHMFQQAQNPNKEELNKLCLCITGFSLVIQLIFFLRATFLPFARFVGGLQMIVKNLIPFIIILMLMNLAFAYSYWIGNGDKEIDLIDFFLETFGNLFNFEPEDTTTTDIIFGISIIIVLLNVVIAIVSETWKSTEHDSIQFLWESRLQRISQLRYALGLRDKLNAFYPHIKRWKMLEFIDSLHDISYQNDVSWTKAPYNTVTERAQYDKPYEYFDNDLAKKIIKAKSLSADLYWAEMDARNNGTASTKGGQLTCYFKLIYILKWLGSCVLYGFLIIIGIATGGIFWPKNFRSGVLSVNT